MAKINPWSLEHLLQVSHPPDAISGTINAENEKYDIKIQTSRRTEQKDFTYFSAEIKMDRARENMFSAEQVHELASLYGGDAYFRMMLQNNRDETPRQFFDINITQREISGDEFLRTLHLPK